ncbi:MAG TPA: HypC/HybG/HupF family hydrogenase formation chaperone [Solirubrobacteraceae bacterium]|nr:HypC/HybG/HupF family hydrogenase formation chaperone [Solirubrobacteraceae bacterium]
MRGFADRPETPASGAPAACGCITCGDAAATMRVVRVDADRELALCTDGEGARHTVETGLVGLPDPGDLLLVHAGVAIAALPPTEEGP